MALQYGQAKRKLEVIARELTHRGNRNHAVRIWEVIEMHLTREEMNDGEGEV